MDLKGKVFKYWLVLHNLPKTKKNKKYWECLCKCGTVRYVEHGNLLRGISQSCGCYNLEVLKARSTTHGKSNLCPEYNIWKEMKARCNRSTHIYFHHYGGRGIKVSEQWDKSFSEFIKDMGYRPSQKHSLDRINNDDGYYKENCRWATKAQQLRNRRATVEYNINGEMKTIAEISAMCNISTTNLLGRLRIGWDIEKAIKTPINSKRLYNK